MAYENISVTLGITYFMELETDRFPELMTDDFVLTGQIRTSTGILVVDFEIIKSPDSNVIYVVLQSADTIGISPNPQLVYEYNVIARDGSQVYELVNGYVTFKKSPTVILEQV